MVSRLRLPRAAAGALGADEQREAAVDHDRLPADHVGVGAGEERDRAGDVVRRDEPSDGVGAAAAVILELVEGVVAVGALVLFEGGDEVEEGARGDGVAVDGAAEGGEDGA